MLIDNALSALTIVLDPARFAVICSGIGLGLIIGMLPGIGGLGGLALLIPFTHSMDAHTALAFLIGMWAVTATSDTIPAILFGVPGAIGSAATVLDGHPMAKRGEAGRAFGASFMSSIVGGLLGAVLLAVSIPILRPFMLAIGTPELLAVCVLGLTLVASVSQGNILKGLIVALFGVLLAAVGDEAQSGQLRWTFDTLFDTYLLDGVPIECIALGLFAVPELIDMSIARTNTGSIQQLRGLFHEQMRGVRDVLRNWKLVLNSATLGVVLGSVPGMGAAVIDWIAYGSAARMVKGASETFGKGDVRGLIAAESANCSREGGALIPTLAFGVPGAPSMALLLGAFLSHGIAPGPKLLDTQLDITYTLVWSLALANVVGAGICFLAANPLARVATLRAGILIPIVLAVCFIGAYQGSKSYGDLVVLVAFGLLGWTMKRYGWARAPLILGFVLGKLIEKYLFISIGRYEFEWLQRPGVITIFALTAVVLLWPLCAALYRQWRPARGVAPSHATAPAAAAGHSIDDIIGPGLWVVALLVFAAAFWGAAGWRLSARLMPQTAAMSGLIVIACAAILVPLGKLRRQSPASRMSVEHLASRVELSAKTVFGRFFVELFWLLGFLAAVWLIGLMPSIGVYVVLYMSTAGKTPWPTALIITASLWIGFYVLFVKLLHAPWPPSLLGDTLPQLREWTGRLI
ncbi:MAG TPA: tripartite tricarboxylate transporter permease [Xanthobacteraceae bacterium]|nr:tripartite tricarboxylate transporter permease [Xanthobacteraceae bacterium]